jgi:hypothetical protein
MIATSPSGRARPATTSSKVAWSPSWYVGWGIQAPSVDHASRTAPIGPSNGIPDTVRAADAALMASTSWGCSWSAPRIVPTTCTSLRNPSGNDGRRGRSISRQVRMAWSVALPSRRKNEPGILPAAYIRSSMSTVRGKKSTPSRGALEAVAVTSTTVLPICPTTAPLASRANLPPENERVFWVPVTGPDTETSAINGSFGRPAFAGPTIGATSESVPSCQPPRTGGPEELATGS